MGVILSDSSSGNGNNAEHDISGGGSKLVAFEVLSVLLQLLSIVFNGAIICTLCRRSLLKYPSNRFVFSLCFSHLFVSFLSISISAVTTFLPFSQSHLHVFENSQRHEFQVSHSSQPLGLHNKQMVEVEEAGKSSVPVQCTGSQSGVDLAHLVMMHLNFGVAVCTSITVALISAERYITIARPMRYKSIVTARRSLYAIICCWLLASLITMMPLLLFENRNPVCGTFSVPMESLATYFGIVFAVVTVFALAVMIVCYTHIFRIAKAKCQKVQIGHFTASTVSSISSDWPSSVYSSVQGQHRFLHAGSRIESSNSLLHWVLLSNLGRHTQPLSHRVPNALRGIPLTPPATPTLPPKNAFFSESALNSRRESDETTTTGTTIDSRNGSTSSSSSNGGNKRPSSYFIDPSRSPMYQYNIPPRKLKNRWRTYLQPNYNSPRKTIFTIMLLIGAVLFTQLPLSFVLFTSTVETTQRWFQFCISVLFSTSSVANPVLYGFLNRSIRDQLWRLLRRKSHVEHGPSASSMRKRKRGRQQLEEMAQTSKGFLSSANHCHLQNLCRDNRTAMEIPAIKISRKDSISSEENSIAHSTTSINSINIIGSASTSGSRSGTVAKMNQVQKRIMSSPYYRTVLLKKANNTKMTSLLPRLALPDVNVRRNSSGSVISIRTNGIMSMVKGKVKELDEELSSSDGNKYEDNGQANQTMAEVHLEMQTFRNYSTPDLQSVQPITTNLDVSKTCQDSEIYAHNDNANDIGMNSQSKDEGQNSLYEDSCKSNSSESNIQHRQEESCMKSLNDNVTHSYGTSSHAVDKENKDSHNQNLEPCLSIENLMGVLIDEELFPENFPRKPSQDSGADMTFSDEEEELSPSPAVTGDHHQPSAVLLSAASLASLPATLTVMLKTGKDAVDDKSRNGDEHLVSSKSSATSLIGPLLFIEHSDGGPGTSSQPVLYLPCSCTSSKETVNDANTKQFVSVSNNDYVVFPQESDVTVTITDSNNRHTQLEPFSRKKSFSNQRLLQVESVHYHRHHPECIKKCIAAYKSKSESDICTVYQGGNRDHSSCKDIKIRSNCHIDCLDLGSKNYSSFSSSHCNGERSTNLSNAVTLVHNYSPNNDVDERGIPSPYYSVWLSNGNLPQSVLTSNSSEDVSCYLNVLPFSQSPQWLSIISMNSSSSSLSSTCPLRILDGSKSDVSDYDDLEDHIEI